MSARKDGRKPPFEVLFAVWSLMVAIAALDILGAFAIFQMETGQTAEEPKPAWVPWLFGFILLLFSLIGASFVLTLKDGDRNIRYFLSYTVLLYGVGFSWPPSWKWLIFLVPIVLIGPLWLPRARRFFDDATDDAASDPAGPRAPGSVP
ncbi:hypothetical protein [Arthrobacter sp. UYEF20]|uniref:hypothetical protein n=1 Tax=Arthrobacter sp. UYEF20 TaxID=1756363 RepID=UPI003393D508